MTNVHDCDVLVLGGGAAGLMCALTAAMRGRRVVILERSEKIGKKILISGGGRCNFTNIGTKPENFISSNPHFCRSALARFTAHDFLTLVEKHNIAYHEKKLGQLFCDGSARQIVSMFEKELQLSSCTIHTNTNILSIVFQNNLYSVQAKGNEYRAPSVVIATGGTSIPKMGATGFGYSVARRFGLRIIEPKPALVPLTFSAKEQKVFGELSGVSIDAIVSCNDISFRENILFTHKGLSGPAILQISSYWTQGDSITINTLPDVRLGELLSEESSSKIELKNFIAQYLPKRFAEHWCTSHITSKPLAHFTHKERGDIAQQLHKWKVLPSGTEGFDKAEVTLGGVDTKELSSKTLEARKQRGLYFIGEVVDVTGWLGGYNFQWAWSSGAAAGNAV
jgi:predicted Rossmann fold flavoprotein